MLNDYIEASMEQVKRWAEEVPEQERSWDDLDKFFLKLNLKSMSMLQVKLKQI